MANPLYSVSSARAALQLWVNARDALATGQSYSIGGRTLTRQDAETVEGMIIRLNRTLLAEEARIAGRVRPFAARASFRAPGSGG